MRNSSGGLLALVVDDEAPIRERTIRALKRVGFRCDDAPDGECARQFLQLDSYDVVVTDLRMPKRNGHALACEILALPSHPVVFVLSDVVEPRIAQDLKARGVDGVFLKPVDYASFAATVKAVVNGRPRPDYDPAVAFAPGDVADSGKFPAKHVVVMLIRDAVGAENVIAQLRSDIVDVLAVENSDQLYRRLRQGKVDVLVLENELEGFLGGIEIIEHLHREGIRPGVILLAERTEELASRATRLGIECILKSNADADMITASARNALKARAGSAVYVPWDATRLVQQHENIPSMPQLIVKLLSWLHKNPDNLPLDELAQDIQVDPAATAMLLKLANSSSSGVIREVTNVSDAVRLIGVKRAIAVVFASAALGMQNQLVKRSSPSLLWWHRRRSVMIGSTAAVFAQQLEHICPDTAFVLGLLQDIGIFVMANHFQKRYENILQRVRNVGQAHLHPMEADEFGITHAEISAAIAQEWQLPQTLVVPILFHHSKDVVLIERTEEELSFIRVMRIGEALSNLADVPHPARRQTFNQLVSRYGSGNDEQCKACVKESVARTSQSSALFSLPIPDHTTLLNLLQQKEADFNALIEDVDLNAPKLRTPAAAAREVGV